MGTSALVLLLVAGGLVLFFVAVRLPRRRATLDRLKLSKSFHGLILFGKDGAYVDLDQPSSGDFVSFTKRRGEEGGWILEVVVSGPGVSESLLNELESELEILGDRFKVEAVRDGSGKCLRFSLAGKGLGDPAALEGVARCLTRCLRHPRSSTYRVRFAGPKDYEAVDKYFGFRK